MSITQAPKHLEAFILKKDFKGAENWLLGHKPFLLSDHWHHQMGVLKAWQEEWPLAKWYFEQDQLWMGEKREAEHNLKIVDAQLGNNNFKETGFWNIYSTLTGVGLLTTSLMLFVILSIMCGRKLKYQARLLILFGSLSPVLLMATMDLFFSIDVSKKAIPLYSGPSRLFETGAEIPAGKKIIYRLAQERKWAKIYYPSQFVGWVKVDESFYPMQRFFP